MPKTRKQKEETVDSLTKAIKGAGSLVFAKFDKLIVSDERALRSGLCDKGVLYKVSKKSLLKRAATDAKVPGEMPPLEGQVAIAYGDDALAPAKGVAEFAKTHAGMMSILGGIYEGKFVNREMMETLASIPSRDALIGMFLNVISSPVRGFVIAVDAVAKKNS